MPLFKCIVEVKKTYLSKIVVEAKDSRAASAYCKNNVDWHDDDLLRDENGTGEYREYKIKQMEEVNNAIDLPSGYNQYNYPWNGNGKITVGEYLENRDNVPDKRVSAV